MTKETNPNGRHHNPKMSGDDTLESLQSRLKREIKNKNLASIKSILDQAKQGKKLDRNKVINDILNEPGSKRLDTILIELAIQVRNNDDHNTFIDLFGNFKHRDLPNNNQDRLSKLLESAITSTNKSPTKFALIDLLCRKGVDPDHGYGSIFNKTSITKKLIGSGELVKLSTKAKQGNEAAQKTFETLLGKILNNSQVKQEKLDNELEHAVIAKDLPLIDWLLNKGAKIKEESLNSLFKDKSLVNNLLNYRSKGKSLLFRKLLRHSNLGHLLTEEPLKDLRGLIIETLSKNEYKLIKALFNEHPINKNIRSVGLRALNGVISTLSKKESAANTQLLIDSFKTILENKDYGNHLLKNIFLSKKQDMAEINKFGMVTMEFALKGLARENKYEVIQSYFESGYTYSLKQIKAIVGAIAADETLVDKVDMNNAAVKLINSLINKVRNDTISTPQSTMEALYNETFGKHLEQAIKNQNFRLITGLLKQPMINNHVESLISDETRKSILNDPQTLTTFLNQAILQQQQYPKENFVMICKEHLFKGLKPKTEAEFKILDRALDNLCANDKNIDLIDMVITMSQEGNKALDKGQPVNLNGEPLITMLHKEIASQNWSRLNDIYQKENFQPYVGNALLKEIEGENNNYQAVTAFDDAEPGGLTDKQCESIILSISSNKKLVNSERNNNAACDTVAQLLTKHTDTTLREFISEELFKQALSSKNIKLIKVFYKAKISVEVNGGLISVLNNDIDALIDTAVSTGEMPTLLRVIQAIPKENAEPLLEKYYKKIGEIRQDITPEENDFYLDDDKLFQLTQAFEQAKKQLNKNYDQLEQSTIDKYENQISKISSSLSAQESQKTLKKRLNRIAPHAHKSARKASEKFAHSFQAGEVDVFQDINIGFDDVDKLRQIKSKNSAEAKSLSNMIQTVATLRDKIADITSDNNRFKRSRKLLEQEIKSLADGSERIKPEVGDNYYQLRNAEIINAFSRLNHMRDELNNKFFEEAEGTLPWKQVRRDKEKYVSALIAMNTFGNSQQFKLDSFSQSDSNHAAKAIDDLLKADSNAFKNWIGHLEQAYNGISANVTDKDNFQLQYGSELKSAIERVKKVVEQHQALSPLKASMEDQLISKFNEAIKNKNWELLQQLNQSNIYQNFVTRALLKQAEDQNYEGIIEFNKQVGLTLEQCDVVLNSKPGGDQVENNKAARNLLHHTIMNIKLSHEIYSTEKTFSNQLGIIKAKFKTIQSKESPALPAVVDDEFFKTLDECKAASDSMAKICWSLYKAISANQLDAVKEILEKYNAFYKDNYIPKLVVLANGINELNNQHSDFLDEANKTLKQSIDTGTLESNFITITQRPPRHGMLVKEMIKIATPNTKKHPEPLLANQKADLEKLSALIESQNKTFNDAQRTDKEEFALRRNTQTTEGKKEVYESGHGSWVKSILSTFRDQLTKAYNKIYEKDKEIIGLKQENAALKEALAKANERIATLEGQEPQKQRESISTDPKNPSAEDQRFVDQVTAISDNKVTSTVAAQPAARGLSNLSIFPPDRGTGQSTLRRGNAADRETTREFSKST